MALNSEEIQTMQNVGQNEFQQIRIDLSINNISNNVLYESETNDNNSISVDTIISLYYKE